MYKFTVEGKKKGSSEWEWVYNGEAMRSDYEAWDIVRKEVGVSAWEVLLVSKYNGEKISTWRITATED